MQMHEFIAFVLEYKVLGLVLLLLAYGLHARVNRAGRRDMKPGLCPGRRSIDPQRDGALHDLLSSLFKPADFRRWVRFDEELAILERDLPGELASPVSLFDAAVTEMRRHGLVRTGLFEKLRSNFPGRCGDIDPVADMFKEVGHRATDNLSLPDAVSPNIQINHGCILIGNGATVGDISFGNARRGTERPIDILGRLSQDSTLRRCPVSAPDEHRPPKLPQGAATAAPTSVDEDADDDPLRTPSIGSGDS